MPMKLISLFVLSMLLLGFAAANIPAPPTAGTVPVHVAIAR